MKNKKGFISLTLVYTFFLVFVAIMIGLLVNFAHTRVLLKNINGRIITTLESKTLNQVILAAHPPVSDAVASTRVSSSNGINFGAISSPANGQGLYINSKNSQDGTVKYFRGGTYCYLNSAAITSASICTTAGGTWTNYHCSLSDSKEACETAGGTYYELKNNVMFGGYAWKIIRINSNGTIRMIYNGTNPKARGTNAQIDTAYYNNLSDTGTGPSNVATEETLVKTYASYENSDNSSLSYKINSWYSNLSDVTSKINDEEFCNDLTWGDTTGINWYFSPYTRANTNSSPSYNCPNTEIYNVTSGKLTNPIATINYDELVYAGGVTANNNYTYYLQSGNDYWTMSPYYWNSDGTMYQWQVVNSGNLNNGSLTTTNGVRPVINLKSDAIVSGGLGTLDDPWVIADI